MNFSEWITAVGVATGMGAEDENLVALVEQAIEYGEGRIYRDPNFDFLAAKGSANVAVTINDRNVTMPSAVLICEAVNVITPAGALPNAVGSRRTPLTRVTLPYIDAVWGVQNTVGQPTVYAPLTDRAWRVGPVPAAAYQLEWVGTIRPAPLSAAIPDTFITENMPELFFAATMVFFAGGLLKNFGAAADDPQVAQSWEAQFNLLKTGPQVEEAKRKSLSAGGSALAPTPLTSPRS